jgi:hypothetical protein
VDINEILFRPSNQGCWARSISPSPAAIWPGCKFLPQDNKGVVSLDPIKTHLSHMLDFWLARGAVVVVIALQLIASNTVVVETRWFAPAVELALLVPLSIATAWTHRQVRRATEKEHWLRILGQRRAIRAWAIFLTALVSVMNLAALVLLVRAMVRGDAGDGPQLLVDAVNIWTTNVIAFALWFWNLDRGGPATDDLVEGGHVDFLFSNMVAGSNAQPDWSPGFVDYIYLSFTNATALSPADTLPLSQRAKLLMLVEACISLLTIALVAARAVNILK